MSREHCPPHVARARRAIYALIHTRERRQIAITAFGSLDVPVVRVRVGRWQIAFHAEEAEILAASIARVVFSGDVEDVLPVAEHLQTHSLCRWTKRAWVAVDAARTRLATKDAG